MQVESGKTTTDDVVKIGDVNVVVKDVGKEPMMFGKSAQTDSQKQVVANDHEASSSSSASKYHQPRWCPPGLSHSQKRRLQRLRSQEQKEQEAEKLRDEHFNKYRPMVPQGKEWRAKPDAQSTGPVESPQVTGLTARRNRSDRSSLLPSRRPKQLLRLHTMKFQQFLQLWVMRNWWIMRLLWSTEIWR